MKDKDELLAKAGQDWLERRSESLDAQTRSKLNQARQAALDTMEKKSRFGLALPLAGASAAAILVAVLMVARPVDSPVTTAPQLAKEVPADDFELLLAVENLEMIEDFEFFELLSAVETDGTGAG